MREVEPKAGVALEGWSRAQVLYPTCNRVIHIRSIHDVDALTSDV